jgi:hypothetical protein
MPWGARRPPRLSVGAAHQGYSSRRAGPGCSSQRIGVSPHVSTACHGERPTCQDQHFAIQGVRTLQQVGGQRYIRLKRGRLDGLKMDEIKGELGQILMEALADPTMNPKSR